MSLRRVVGILGHAGERKPFYIEAAFGDSAEQEALIEQESDVALLQEYIALCRECADESERQGGSPYLTRIRDLIRRAEQRIPGARWSRALRAFHLLADPGADEESLDGLLEDLDPAKRRQYIQAIQLSRAQGALPLRINALSCEGEQGFVNPLWVCFTTDSRCECRFDTGGNPEIVTALITAAAVCEPFLRELYDLPGRSPNVTPPASLGIAAMIGDFPGALDGAFYGPSYGLALALAIYFNYLAWCFPELRPKLERVLRRTAVTGALAPDGGVGKVEDLDRKAKAAQAAGLEAILAPAANGRVEGASPVVSFAHALALIRYGRYLREAEAGRLPQIVARKVHCYLPPTFSELLSEVISISSLTFSERTPERIAGPMRRGRSDDESVGFGAPEREKIVPNRPFHEVFTRQNLEEGLLLVGQGGIGKTTLLLERLSRYARSILDWEAVPELGGTKKVPLYLPLVKWEAAEDQPVSGAWLQRELAEGSGLELEPRELEIALRQGQFLLLLDGVDEMPARGMKGLRQFIDQCQKAGNLVVLSSRVEIEFAELRERKRFEIEPFRKAQIQEYVGKFEAAGLLNPPIAAQLNEVLPTVELAGVPFFLGLMVDIARSGAVDLLLFRNKGRLIDRAVEELFQHEAEKAEYAGWVTAFKKNKEALRVLLPAFAFQLYREKRPHRFRLYEVPPEIPEKLKLDLRSVVGRDVVLRPEDRVEIHRIKEIMLNWCPIVEKYGSLSEELHYIFTNKIFFEYLAACGLRDEFLDIVKEQGKRPGPGGRVNEFLQTYINRREHEPVIALLTGLLADCDVLPGKIACRFTGERSFLCQAEPTCAVEARKQTLS